MKTLHRSTILLLAALGLLAAHAHAGTLTTSLLDEEADIVNTGGTLVSASSFGDPAQETQVVVNGLLHPTGTAAGANLTINSSFEGDFRNGGSGLPQDGSSPLQVLLSGIAGANSLTMSISGLTVGQDYLFQTYWEDNLPRSLTVTIEGDTVNNVAAQKPGVLISYAFKATDDTLNVFADRDDSVPDPPPTNWLSGYSLQEVGGAGNPQLVSTDPENGVADVLLTTSLTATFDKTVQAPAVGTGNIEIYKSDDTLVEQINAKDTTPPGTVTFLGSTLEVDPSNPLEGGVTYYVLIDSTAVTDSSDNPFAGISDKTEWTFTGDGTAPSTTDLDPEADADDVPVNIDLTLTFDEPVMKGVTGTIVIRLEGDDSAVQTVDVHDAAVTVDGAEVTVVLADLAPATHYVEITSGAFTDLSGNPFAGISGKAAWRFTTSATVAAIITSLLDEETDIVNTGGLLVSAASFGDPTQETEVVVNGLVHPTGTAAGANFSSNKTFEGDFRNGGSGLPQDGSNPLQVLLSGIAGANPLTMEIGGLTIGQDYLFQTYWEDDLNKSLTVTIEGHTVNRVAAQKPGVLISYAFTALDDTLNVFADRDDGTTQNNWFSGYSLQEVPPTGFRLALTPNASNPGNYDFSWAAQDQKNYDLVSTTDLTTEPQTWLVWDGRESIPGTAPSNTLTNVAGGGTPRYFAVLEKDPPPFFEDDFESDLGWTTGVDGGTGTAWARGTPSGVGPAGANSPVNCYATNLDANYGNEANVYLRSPEINLSSLTSATLTFQQFTDIESGFDAGVVRVLKASDLTPLGADIVNPVDGTTTEWTEFSAPLPPEALGENVVLEFRFTSDDFAPIAQAGWYIDDVRVTVPAP